MEEINCANKCISVGKYTRMLIWTLFKLHKLFQSAYRPMKYEATKNIYFNALYYVPKIIKVFLFLSDAF